MKLENLTNKTHLLTLQFPDFGALPRKGFLAVVHRYVTTFALQRQEVIAQLGGNAGYFHTIKESPKPVPILIHSLQKDKMLTLRAYTQPAIETLQLWHRLFMEAHPELCGHVIETKETFTCNQLDKPHTYRSTNWIPYRNMECNDQSYSDKDTGKSANFTSRLTGNLRTFVNNIHPNPDGLHIEVALEKISADHNPVTALIKKQADGLLPITKYAFTATLTTNLELPVYFSLGQNVGYGNGVFERI